MNNEMEILSKKLRFFRESRKMSMLDLGEKSGVGYSYVRMLEGVGLVETDNPSAFKLLKISETLNVNLSLLIDPKQTAHIHQNIG